MEKCFSIYQRGNWFKEISFQDQRNICKKGNTFINSITERDESTHAQQLSLKHVVLRACELHNAKNGLKQRMSFYSFKNQVSV